MLNLVWLGLMLTSFVCAVYTGQTDQVVQSVAISASKAFHIALDMGGLMVFWMGLMRIAEDAQLIKKLGRLLQPVLKKLFPQIPKDHPAMGAIVMNYAANMLGLSNTATPLALRAMEELESLNKTPGTATDSMCMFVTVNASSLQLIPTTTMALLSKFGGINTTVIIVPIILASSFSTITGIILARACARIKRRRT